MRSACRGEARKTSMPKRARSYRPAPDAIISIAQQASPKVAGHSEDLRVQLTSFSTLVSRTPLGSFSSRPIRTPRSAERAPSPPRCSLPLEPAAAPDVGVGDEDGHDEYGHLDQAEDPERVVGDRPRVEKDDLDVENDEQHRGQVVLHRETAAGERLVDR